MISLFTALGAVMLAGGSLNYFTFPHGLGLGLKTFVNLKENGMVYPLYMNPPFPSESSYYLYELKNPKEFMSGAKPKLHPKGPFKFQARLKRSNIKFREAGDLVKFDSRRELSLKETQSQDLDEEYITINPILLGIHGTVRSLILDRIPFQRVTEPIVFNAVNVIIDTYNERLLVKTTARKTLMGRKVELLDSLMSLASRFGLQSLIPPGPPNGIFGVAYVQNETTDTLEIWTGAMSDKFAEVNQWRGKEQMSIWKGSCNNIDGTNGELFKPMIDVNESIKIFLAPLCRSFTLDPVSDEKVQLSNGLTAAEFELTPRLFLGARKNPANKCYCKDVKTYDCQYDGLVQMGPCFFDSPLYFAKGNFEGADRRIRGLLDEDTFDTVLPDKQSFYIDPTTGTVLAVNISLLATFKMVRQQYMRDLSRVQNLTYAPLFQASENLVVPHEYVWQIGALQTMIEYYKPASLGIALVGSGILLMRFIFKGRSVKVDNSNG